MNRRRAFTLVEVLVAVSILGAGVALAMGLFAGGLNLASVSREYVSATLLAQELMVERLSAFTLNEGDESGEECDYHYHDCDEYWFILEGRAKIIEDGVEYEVEPGDCVFTPMGSEHKIIAITDCVEFWCELEYRGRKRRGHLHRGDED